MYSYLLNKRNHCRCVFFCFFILCRDHIAVCVRRTTTIVHFLRKNYFNLSYCFRKMANAVRTFTDSDEDSHHHVAAKQSPSNKTLLSSRILHVNDDNSSSHTKHATELHQVLQVISPVSCSVCPFLSGLGK